jgi:hypothetical protein
MSISCRSLPCAPVAAPVAVLVAVALSLIAVTSAGAVAPEAPATTFAASAAASGELADGLGAVEYTPVGISEDGRYVAFQSASQNLGEAGPPGVVEGFVKDLETGEVELVSRADGPAGEPAAGPGITTLTLSGDGRHVVFTSAATNLGTALPGEEAGEAHVYERDLDTGVTTLVDRVSGVGGEVLARGAEADSISADGSVAAFTARVANLEDPAGDHAETANPIGYVRDLADATTVAVSRASGAAGELADESAATLSLSPDGRAVTFESRATNLGAGAEGYEQVYLRDLAAGTTTLLSRNALGEPGDLGSSGGNLSGGEGCFSEIESNASNLLAPARTGLPGGQTYVIDRCAEPPTTELISLREGGRPVAFSYSGYQSSAATADGGEAVFAAEFTGSPCCHLYLRDHGAGTTQTLDRASGEAGALANEQVQFFAISANGCRVAFATAATNLGAGTVPDPGEGPTEIYVRQLAPCASGGGGGESPGGGSGGEEPSGDGTGGGSPGLGEGSGGGSPGASPSSSLRPALRSIAIAKRRLVAVANGPGPITVTIRRHVSGSRHGWRLVRTIRAAADAAGRASIPLPRLAPGRYRVEVHLRGAPRRVRTLTVGRSGRL